MKIRIRLTLLALLTFMAAGACSRAGESDGTFLVKPYVQLGNSPKLSVKESLIVLWHTSDTEANWSVELRPAGTGAWMKMATPTLKRIAVPTLPPHRVYSALLSGLTPGGQVEYRVLRGGKPVFTAKTRARVPAEQPYRFVVFGDCAQASPGQRAVAYQTYNLKPDFVFITGDIVYGKGLISEYRSKYFPIYNAERPAPSEGAPLTRSVPFLASVGNHDVGGRDLGRTPDGMAYFLYWAQPLNGPLTTPDAPNATPLTGPEQNKAAFLKAAGGAFPRMLNFSFDYGNSHWLVLDADPYVNWADPALREWVRKDLAAAKNATWRFVGFHQPGFHSSKAHSGEDQMRVLADVFEQGKVDIVFNGHVHNYQRTYPMRFAIAPEAKGKNPGGGRVPGTWQLDKQFNGVNGTKANGVIYIVTGAGGAGLYNPEQEEDPSSLQDFTARYIAREHSLTVVDITGTTLKLRQVGGSGKILDTLTLTK